MEASSRKSAAMRSDVHSDYILFIYWYEDELFLEQVDLARPFPDGLIRVASALSVYDALVRLSSWAMKAELPTGSGWRASCRRKN